MAYFDKHTPDTLQINSTLHDKSLDNKHLKNLDNTTGKENLICVLENTGVQFIDDAMNYEYKLDNTNKQRRKKICKFINKSTGPYEKGLYIHKDDWINPDDDYECAVFNKIDNSRVIYDVDKKPRKFVSKKLCNKYYNKNNESNFYTRLIQKKFKKKLDRYNSKKKVSNNGKILLITLIIICVFIIFWTAKYHVKKPYYFYDYVKSIFVNKAIFVIILFGLYIYTFCPFNMCTLDESKSLFRRDFNKAIKLSVCKLTNNPTKYFENKIINYYDNNRWVKYIRIIIYYINKITRLTKPIFNFINNLVCNKCNYKNICIDIPDYNTFDIITKEIIEIDINDLYTINENYKINNKNNLYETGSILRFNKSEIFNNSNNKLFICCIILKDRLLEEYKINNFDYDIAKLENELKNELLNYQEIEEKLNKIQSLKDIEKNINFNFEYKWIELKSRKGPQYYIKSDKIDIKINPYNERILSVDNNYDLLGYNIELDIEHFIYLFESNNSNYTDLPYIPTFYREELEKYFLTLSRPEFIKRKLITIYTYLVDYPFNKHMCKNITIKDNQLLQYGNNKIFELNKEKSFNKELNDKIDKYLKISKKTSQLLKELNDYYEDSDDDIDYLNYYLEKIRINWVINFVRTIKSKFSLNIFNLYNFFGYNFKDHILNKDSILISTSINDLKLKIIDYFNDVNIQTDLNNIWTNINFEKHDNHKNISKFYFKRNHIYNKNDLLKKINLENFNLYNVLYDIYCEFINLDINQRKKARKDLNEYILNNLKSQKDILLEKLEVKNLLTDQRIINKDLNNTSTNILDKYLKNNYITEKIINKHNNDSEIYDKDGITYACTVCKQSCK